MTQIEKPKPRLVFATKTLQQVPFTLGGQTFTSKRLTAEEELLFQEANSIASLGLNPGDDLLALLNVLGRTLSRRHQSELAITEWSAWAAQHLGPNNMQDVMAYLRTGHNGPGLIPREGESFDLPEVEPVQIGDRTFAGRLMNYAEYRQLRSALNEMGLLEQAGRFAALGQDPANLVASGVVSETLEGVKDFYHQQAQRERQKAGIVSDMLNARIADEGEAIDGDWLLEQLDLEQLGAVLNFYLTGESPEPEGDTPNAESTPDNLQLNA